MELGNKYQAFGMCVFFVIEISLLGIHFTAITKNRRGNCIVFWKPLFVRAKFESNLHAHQCLPVENIYNKL